MQSAAIVGTTAEVVFATVIEVRPFSAQVEATIIRERMMATLAVGFVLLALTLACVGVYGLLRLPRRPAHKEIGSRTALGAQRMRVVALVVKGAARTAIGGAIVLLTTAAQLATYLPALRASRLTLCGTNERLAIPIDRLAHRAERDARAVGENRWILMGCSVPSAPASRRSR
jgi:hypothetical protein